MPPLLYLLFILSGAAGLFYESVWSRYLSLFVGHGAYAQVIVLVIFLGGMAAGAGLVSRVTERLRDPLYGYAMIELAVGLLGLAFHDLIYLPVTEWAYDWLFPALGGGAGVVVAKWTLAGLLILPQSVLLGTTFPLMSAGVLRRAPRKPGTVLSWLYFSNSLGAAMGVLVAGFYLVRVSGLPGTLIAAAIINLLVGLAALVIAKGTNAAPAAGRGASPAPPGPGYPDDLDLFPLPVLARLLLAVSAGTALASFIYEVAWIRLLSLVLGSATHSFELMLSAFILGLALGAFWIRRRSETLRRPLLTLSWVQVFMGLLAAASLAMYEWSFYWTADLMSAVARSEEGYAAFTTARYVLCLAIMLPATFCAGMTLPLITRSLLVAGAGERAIGAVYGVNTFGSIVGAGAASLLLIPLLGLKGTLLVGAMLDIGIGVAIGVALQRYRAPAVQVVTRGAILLVLVPLVVGLGVRLDRAMLTSGVYRTGQARLTQDTLLYYRDGRTATVSAALGGTGRFTIATNGKPDGSLDPIWRLACKPDEPRRMMTGDDPTQVLLPLITLAHRPAARSAAVIGHGTGMSSHTLLASPALESLVTIEIEPRMVEASRIFMPANKRVFGDLRGRHAFNDAKAYFAAANTRFDIIMAEPSNPWVSGVSGLFTDEFYRRVRRYVADGGVLGQWLHTYELSDELVLGVLAAIHRNFADYAIYSVNHADLLIVATPEGELRPVDWAVFDLPVVREDLCHFFPVTTQDLEATRLTNRRALTPLLEAIQQPNSDFYPVLDLGAERARFLGRAATGLESLFRGVWDFSAGPGVPPLLPDTQTVSALGAVPRIRALMTAASLRGKLGRAEPDTAWVTDNRDDIDHRVLTWVRGLDQGGPPEAWSVWVRAFFNGFELWHGGSRGYVDLAFAEPVRRYLARHLAPRAVVAAVDFRLSMARMDWAAVAGPVERLVPELQAGQLWMDPDALREGGVMAYLARSRPDSAILLFRALPPSPRQFEESLRIRLLASYLGEGLQKPGTDGAAATPQDP